MTEIPTVAEGWLDDEPAQYKKLRAIREQTAGCPCECCVGWSTCATTGHECEKFKTWVQRPTTGAMK